jgi:hypothetical protein
MARSDAVAMDLRDFGPQNQGCVFELQSLLERVPAGRVALLVDDSTDQAFLRSTLEACGARVTAGSPNAGRKVAIAGVDVGAGEAVAVERLMQWAAGVATLAAADPPAATAAGVGQDGPARYL